MSEEIRLLKEILDNEDLDNYAIDDDECYLNGYARRCLKKVLEEIERLNKDNGDITKLFAKERQETKRLHSIIKEVRDLVNKEEFTMKQKYEMREELLEILDKENNNGS